MDCPGDGVDEIQELFLDILLVDFLVLISNFVLAKDWKNIRGLHQPVENNFS